MIFGKTPKQREVEDLREQIKRARNLLPKVGYAWIPTKIYDYRDSSSGYIWLESYIYCEYNPYAVARMDVDNGIGMIIFIRKKGMFMKYDRCDDQWRAVPVKDNTTYESNVELVQPRVYYEELLTFIKRTEEEIKCLTT